MTSIHDIHDIHDMLVQTGGSALMDILTGVVSPAGRLPNTWPASLDQVRCQSAEKLINNSRSI